MEHLNFEQLKELSSLADDLEETHKEIFRLLEGGSSHRKAELILKAGVSWLRDRVFDQERRLREVFYEKDGLTPHLPDSGKEGEKEISHDS